MWPFGLKIWDGGIREEGECRRLFTDTPGRRKGLPDLWPHARNGYRSGVRVMKHARCWLSGDIREEDRCRR